MAIDFTTQLNLQIHYELSVIHRLGCNATCHSHELTAACTFVFHNSVSLLNTMTASHFQYLAIILVCRNRYIWQHTTIITRYTACRSCGPCAILRLRSSVARYLAYFWTELYGAMVMQAFSTLPLSEMHCELYIHNLQR